jgi:hypothetical protein
MKTLWKAAAAIAVCATLLAAFAAPALAANASVTYEGNADRFVFLPASDLFQNFKGVMPGDMLTQQITVKNDTSNGVKVKIYLRAEPVSEGDKAFLGQMRLTVVQDGSSVLFDAAADQRDGLASDVCLGTFYSGADIDLTVSLAVPIGMGNEFQDDAGTVRWVFTAEELPIEPDDPDTGDASNIWLYGALYAVSAAGLLALLLFRRGKAKSHKPGQKTDV